MALQKTITVGTLAVLLALLGPAPPVDAGPPQAGSVILPNLPPDYDWWNGCAPTTAAMLFAWWGQQGYGEFPANYPAPPATYPLTSTNSADYTDARGVIAGWANKQEGIKQGIIYGSYENHPPDSLADFLLTYNGDTDISNLAHGLVTFGAWDDPRTPQIESRRFVASMTYAAEGGFTYEQYVAEINAGRPVYLGWSSASVGHATLGVGYNNTGGKHDVITLTTWHQGPQEWQWANETVSGYGLSIDSGVLLQPASGATPRLSAYLSIARPFIADLTVELGIGNPQNPEWKTIVWNAPFGSAQNLVLTDIDATPELARFRTNPLNWYIKVSSVYGQYGGTIQDFQIRYGLDQHVFHYTGSPVPIVANGSAYVYLNSTSFAVFSTWQGSGTSTASWGNDAAWDQGVPQYAGDTATLDNSIGSAANAIITLDGDRTISGLTFSNTAGGSYRIVQGSSGSLTLGSSAGPVPITVTAGSHTIAAPVVLNSDVMISTSSSAAMTISAQISGSGSLEKAGMGTLTLLGSNTYSGDTTVDAGVLTALAISGTGNTTVLAGATLQVNFLEQNQLTIGPGALVVIGVVTDLASSSSFLLPLGEGQGPSRVTGIAASPDAGSTNGSFTAAEPSTLMLMAIGVLGLGPGFARRVRAEARKKEKG